ncbi:MAG: ATP-binding protein, partial [Bacteroidales bacterium]|nr:ATP-binding protein [Bacteroidales bacterium]
YIMTHNKPFDELRVTIITLSGAVIYDNVLLIDSLDNHRERPEVIQALKNGSGYHIGRQSASDGREYFYSATKGERVVVRTAIPYSSSLDELLKADWNFLIVMISISVVMSVVAYFITRKLGKDIEHIKRYEAEQEKNILKRQLTNNINHELKTPVASIQVCLETLLSGISLSDEKRQELIERCYTNNERLRRLLNDVSLITRMEDGSALISKERIVVNDIIKEVADELEIMPKEERLNLHTDFDEQVVMDGNISLIGSIFRNLTENAIAYSEGRNIYISLLENNDEECRISFEDDGKGVQEEQLPRLFERFYRVDKGRSRQKGGTGLGLAIVKHAVQFHGGTIKVNNRPDGGLRFEFSLKK